MNQPAPADSSLLTYTHVIYALHALSVLIGVTGPATIVGSFVFGLPSIIAVIMNYVRRSDVRGSWLDSHFSWQIRTFWWGLVWTLVGMVLLFALGLGLIVLGVVYVWLIYRVVKGFLKLTEGRPVFAG
jgi:uncharacterized membrane protein